MNNISYAIAGHFRSLSIAGASQIVSSASNFVLSFYLLTSLTKPEFGLYNVGFSCLLVLSGIPIAIVSLQMAVSLPEHNRAQVPNFVLAHLYACAVINSIAIFIALVLLGLYAKITRTMPDLFLCVTVLVGFSVFSVRDLFTRYLYSLGKEYSVLIATSLGSAFIAIVIILCWLTRYQMDAGLALALYVAGLSIAMIFSMCASDIRFGKICLDTIFRTLNNCWVGGCWALGSSIIHSVRSQVHTILIAPMAGVSAVADINAARLFLSPLLLVIPSVSAIFLPRFASLRAANSTALLKYGKLFVVVAASFSALYSCLVVILGRNIIFDLLAVDYKNVPQYVYWWCVAVIFMFIKSALVVLFESTKAFREVALANFVGTLLVFCLGLFLVNYKGGVGIIFSMIVGDITICLLLQRGFREVVKRRSLPEAGTN
jgi:O-antigen/teichoic acid export membrane protein